MKASFLENFLEILESWWYAERGVETFLESWYLPKNFGHPPESPRKGIFKKSDFAKH